MQARRPVDEASWTGLEMAELRDCDGAVKPTFESRVWLTIAQ